MRIKGSIYVTVYYDRVPKGEVQVRRASAVISRTAIHWARWTLRGRRGRAHHALRPERGHLWGRKEVTVIRAVARVESAVHVACPRTRSVPPRRSRRPTRLTLSSDLLPPLLRRAQVRDPEHACRENAVRNPLTTVAQVMSL
jgi:hypothetical protein